MKIYFCFFLFLCISSCTKEDNSTVNTGDCGVTGIEGPVRYYLDAGNHAVFNSYLNFSQLWFVDSISNDSLKLKLNAGSVWNSTSASAQHEGDTVDVGETAGLDFYGFKQIRLIGYNFYAYPLSDSIFIDICADTSNDGCFCWTLDMNNTMMQNTSGRTPFYVSNNLTLLSHTFNDVYILQNGNMFNPGDPSNECYYTKANGVIAFTDKRAGRFWVRTTY
jgi:hypothetical protein